MYNESLEGAEEEEFESEPESVQSSWRAEAGDVSVRLDVFVTAKLAGSTRSESQRLIEFSDDESGGVRVNGKRLKSNYKLRAGDEVSAERAAPKITQVLAEDIPLKIVFEDSDMLVIDKARGMVTHPAPGAETGTLVNAVLAHAKDLSGIGGELRPGIVHRLDKDTGGLILVAKTDFAHHHLQAQIQSRGAERKYLALVWGRPNFEQGKIEAPIGRHPVDRKKMAVITDSRYVSRFAVTDLTTKSTYNGLFTLMEAKLQTGRTHQIRVHCAYIHHPIVGDPVYGGVRKVPSQSLDPITRHKIEVAIEALEGQALHAFSLSFNHPRTETRMSFLSPLPEKMQSLLKILSEL